MPSEGLFPFFQIFGGVDVRQREPLRIDLSPNGLLDDLQLDVGIEAEDLAISSGETALDGRKARAPVDSMQRFVLPLCKRNDGVDSPGLGGKESKKGRIEKRHIAGRDDDQVICGRHERCGQTSERTAGGMVVGFDANPEFFVGPVMVGDDEHVLRESSKRFEDPGDQRLPPELQEGFIPSQAAALSPTKDDGRKEFRGEVRG